ncbi:unnamed protein product [Peniophora sp. CBMAI 1063]|nr:unnamed protein product [Peniophora sp. CBMAI 1063]
MPADKNLLLAYPREAWSSSGSLNYILVFGDSYSAHDATWIGHLTRSNLLETVPDVQIHAFDGASVEEDLDSQIARFHATAKTFAADQTTYFFFLGINDCGQTDTDDLDSIVELLLDAVHNLYVKDGARNFVFFDVPPTDRSPGAIAIESEETMINRTTAWNDSLRRRVGEFAEETPRASVFLFSTHAVLSSILDDPSLHGFTSDDIAREGGAIWEDELHPTTEVHAIIADKLAHALVGDGLE